MFTHSVWRSWCWKCKVWLAWQEPTARRVDRIQCPTCGGLFDATKGMSFQLKGEVLAVARTFVERKKEEK